MTVREFVQLDSCKATLIVDCRKKTPAIIYWGKRLSQLTTPQMLASLSTRQEAKCSVVKEAAIALTPLLGEGFTGAPGLELSNQSLAWSVGGSLIEVEQSRPEEILFTCIDPARGIKLSHRLILESNTSVLSAETSLQNIGKLPINLNWCAAPTIPLPHDFDKLMSFEGRWSNEFQRKPIDLFLGSYVRENRKGKTSHDNFPGLVVHCEATNETSGECLGFHLGWSGNHKMRAELLADGRSYAQFGELLLPGEIILEPDEVYSSPRLYSAYSNEGFNGLSDCFHQYVRQQILTPSMANKPRPVHYNTWEGIYFDHDTETLKTLADRVADLGVERFVLDDGWFKGRRGDYAGLGDWTVDDAVYPEGLGPLIEHVKAKGMEFGLWFEPEMVNPDSDLYRTHPDWVLSTKGNEQLEFRNQLVLDLNRSEVCEYLLEAINAILQNYPDISYIKWDMNRDLNHAGNYLGQPAVNQQTKAFYELVERLKSSYPGIEIESCSSGGGRADYGVLAHTDRIWTSDSNDALDRLTIQRGFSYFFPAEIMGAHIGPRDCHITGRRVDIAMRGAVALFGHLGIEMDPRELTDDEAVQVAAVISLYKKHRQLIHSGKLIRLNSNSDSINFGIVNADQSHALFAYNCVRETARTIPPKYRFAGLTPQSQYRLNWIWPIELKEYSPSIMKEIDGQILSGEALMSFGMQLPITNPQTSLLFELNKVELNEVEVNKIE